MQDSPTVAILISTYNWPRALGLVLQSILAQTRMPDEVVIADDGSSLETQEQIAGFTPLFPVSLRHVWHADKGFRKTLILNKAVKQIRSDYIIEIDGDIILHPEFVGDHLRFARKRQFVQGSRCMLTPPFTEEILRSGEIRFRPFRKGLKNSFNAIRIPLLSPLIPTGARSQIRGCNLAFWREDYIRVNGYYNGFVGWGSEDSEFAARLINAGVSKRIVKWACICYHLHHPHSDRNRETLNLDLLHETEQTGLTRRGNGYEESIPENQDDV